MRRALVLVCLLLSSAVMSAQFNVPAPEDVKAAPADAAKTASGLASKVITPGKGGGAHPGASDLVMINFTGWSPDGTMIETNLGKGVQTIALGSRIQGLIEGVQLMTEGETRRFWIPEALAFKSANRPKGPVVYEIELVGSMPNSKPK